MHYLSQNDDVARRYFLKAARSRTKNERPPPLYSDRETTSSIANCDMMLLTKVEIASTSRWNRRYSVAIDEFAGFPKDIARIVSEYVIAYQYLDWIDQSKINHDWLCENPNAYYAGLVTEDDDPEKYAQNPAMRTEILANWDKCIRSKRIMENPAVFSEVIENISLPNAFFLSFNTHRDAVDLILRNPDWADYQSNPMLIEHIRKIPREGYNSSICANSAAIDIIQSLDMIDGDMLSLNPHPWAIEYLHLHQNMIDWEYFSSNPGIFEKRTCPKLLAVLSE